MYRYNLTNKNKTTCPACGHKRKLSRYYDNEENVLLSDEYGRCDREIKCGYHHYPKDNNVIVRTNIVETKPTFHNVIPYRFLLKSLERQGEDKLSVYLYKHFDKDVVKGSLRKYKVGFSTKFDGDSTIFWQIAKDGVRSGKIMQYTKFGKRKKSNGFSFTTWVHSEIYKENFELKQELFGLHLSHRHKTIVVVESEKTALICDMFFNNKNYVFMACGQLRGLQPYKFSTFNNYKEIVLINDFGKAKDIWLADCTKIGKENVRVSNCIDNLGLKDGDDIADAILSKKITDKVWISQI